MNQKLYKVLLNFRLAHKFGVSEEAFLRNTEDVMEELVRKSDQVIKWPSADQYQRIAAEYNASGRYICQFHAKNITVNTKCAGHGMQV